ncbi:SusC/RagA family TonB-linked outer membrane protein [Filimonas effusa]|uniref:SusC/RagA family TonB-linked outer membrane protein n=1 Tax=Filimonas effusa TaxID=2508721 RepID=A0A4Q1DDK0_9BACT|nr:SusC/RagA family TonB-linked outer membrane protein [Filimonas effusa]RXK86955.1 SusC/RagA family TonB-linked outer membrane protein [Filimonas effusa]
MIFKANARRHPAAGIRIRVKQMLLIMRLTIFLILAACLQVAARGNAQTISLSEKNVSLQKVFRQIQQQMPYDFVYNFELLKQAGNVDVNVRNASLEQVLQLCLKGKPLTYLIFDNTIVIKSKERAAQQLNMEWVAAPPPAELVGGVVVDDKGAAVAGASVMVSFPPGGPTGITRPKIYTQTNEKGEFKLPYFSGVATITISYIGFNTVELKVSAQSQRLRVMLQPQETKLTELVITGYSTKKVSEITGSVQSLSGDDIRKGVSTANTLAMLKGKAAGLYIVEAGTSNGSVANRGQVIMRGQASLPDASNTNFGPLIVLDGVITTADNLQDIVDATDIESVTLLKDAASTAIYGSRAAQGVLLVTTRRGTPGKLSVNVNMNYGKVQNNRLINYMNTAQATTHIEKYMQALYNGTPSLQSRYGSFSNYFNTTRTFTEAERNTNYDWSNDGLFPDGKQSDVNLSLTSGNDKTRFYGSVNWLKQDGTLLDDRLDRKSIRLNIDQKVSNKLSVGISTNVIVDKYTASSGENQSYVLQPWVSPYKADGQMADSIPNYTYSATGPRILGWYSNPLYRHELNTAITSRQSYLGTGVIKYAITPWLSVQSTNTYQYIYNNVNTYRDPRTYRGKYNGPSTGPVYMNGELYLTDTKTNYMLTSNLLSFNKRFGDHQVSALVGQEYGKTKTESISVSGYNTPYPGERNLGAFLNYGSGTSAWIYVRSGLPIPPSSPATLERASFSMFSEINDNYKGKYFGSVSLRRDASSNFGKLNRYGTFYSVSGAWLLGKEQFMANARAITNLKLRASYGTSGREAGADFLNFTTFQESTAYGYDNTSTVGAAIQRLANNEITWETTYTTNVGFDIGFWDRINLTVDVYNRLSKGLLQTVTLPTYQGSLSQIRNVGELRNRGIDILLSTTNIQSRNFSWTTDFNISFNSNRLTKLYGDSLIDGFSRAYYRYVGEDINSLKAIKYAGVNPNNGRPLFERVMADKSIQLVDSIPLVKQDGLRGFRSMGSATPTFFGGMTNTFRYKGFTLSVLLNFVYGNKIFNNGVRNFISPNTWTYGQNGIQPNDAIRFWSGPGDTRANYPNYYDLAFSERGATNISSSLLIQDASYLRLRNVRLAYDLPSALVNRARMKSVNIYVSVDNLAVVNSRELYASDPEGAVIGTSASNIYGGAGIYSSMPRRFLAGINIGL